MGRLTLAEVAYQAWYSTFCGIPQPAPPWERIPLFQKQGWSRVASTVVANHVRFNLDGLALGCLAFEAHVKSLDLRKSHRFAKQEAEVKKRWYFVAMKILDREVKWDSLMMTQVEDLL